MYVQTYFLSQLLKMLILLIIVCLTQVWQSLLPLFCDKTFEFAIQTWQTSLEHYYVYVQTYFLSQLRKMLILPISSYCKMCTLPILRSRVFVCCEQYKHARLYCWQWTHFTMGPNEQNQHFAELRQKICLYIHVVVLLICLPTNHLLQRNDVTPCICICICNESAITRDSPRILCACTLRARFPHIQRSRLPRSCFRSVTYPITHSCVAKQ